MQCFGSRDHSRYFVNAYSDHMGLYAIGTDSVVGDIPGFQFGSLVETQPQIDRIWSNMAMGYNSSFFWQLGQVNTFSLNLYTDDRSSNIVFSPIRSTYVTSVYSPYYAVDAHNKRFHSVRNVSINGVGACNSTVVFHIDSGNPGITIIDESMHTSLPRITNGKWMRKKRTVYHDEERQESIAGSVPYGLVLTAPYTPGTAPDLEVVLPGPGDESTDVVVVIKGPNWVLDDAGQTIFSTYHKNVLGLPFLVAANEVVFDDNQQNLYFPEPL